MKNLTKFLSEVQVELSRVEWPSFKDFIGYTIVVLSIVVIFAIFFGVVDKILSIIAQYIFSWGR